MIRITTGLLVAAGLMTFAAPAAAQIRAPSLDPVQQRLNAIALKVDAATQAANRQVVAFHMAPEDLSWSDQQNTFPANNERGEKLCQDLLGDRYGRMIARRAQLSGERWYFSHLVCETKP
jgi:hypothetical protein